MSLEQSIREKFQKLEPILNEQQKRLWAAAEAMQLGYGGVSTVHRATHLSRSTIHNGMQELTQGLSEQEVGRIRRIGGGRNVLEEEFPNLREDLKELVESSTRGDPTQALLWTSKSTDNLAQELKKKGYSISDRTVALMLQDMGYSLQANFRAIEDRQHPNRNEQFEHINERIKEFQLKKQPVISVDTKKKELVGNFKNAGQEWRPRGSPRLVNAHDFAEEGDRNKAIPYGIYDVTWNTGWVNVGVDHDTAEFAVESIRRWWLKMGRQSYMGAKQLLIVADSGGSNSSRGRLWKIELQKLANEIGLELSVSHLPPGTSKWNKIEHRLFSHITKNWRARPLTSYEVVVNSINSTKTKKGLKVHSEMDYNEYPSGKKVSNGLMRFLKIQFHDAEKWNYTISPRAI